jgi:hypothetical protein
MKATWFAAWCTVGFWSVLLARIVQAAPLGTVFTYQGRLNLNGSPVNDSCDFAFSLWDDGGSGQPPTGGNQIGSTLTFDGQGGSPAPISVANGLFTVELDFGPSAFDGDERFLEIKVRCPTGVGGYTTLARASPSATVRALYLSRNRRG